MTRPDGYSLMTCMTVDDWKWLGFAVSAKNFQGSRHMSDLCCSGALPL
jgi:hypothetical protein